IEWGLASRFSARAGIAVGDDDVVEVLPLAKRSDVGADAPAKPYRAAGSRRRECGDGIDKFGCRVNAAAAAPTGPPAKRVAAASVDQAIVPSIKKNPARGHKILPIAAVILDLKYSSVIEPVAEKRGLKLVPISESDPCRSRTYLERRRDELVYSLLMWSR